MAKKTKRNLRTTVVSILQNADDKDELFNQTTDKIFAVIHEEMCSLQEALRSKINIMYDDNTDEFLTNYIKKNYDTVIKPGGIKVDPPVDRISTKIAAMKSSLCIVLSSVGNPDFKQYAPISPKKIVPASTLLECQKLAEEYIHAYDLGGGNWTGGEIFHPAKGLIATVSYNGKVFKGKFWDLGSEEYPKEDLNKTWQEL